MPAWHEVAYELLRDRRSALVGYAALFTLDGPDAEDLVHDAIIRTFAKPRPLTDVYTAEGYVRSAIRTMFIDSARRKVSWRSKIHLLGEPDHVRSPEHVTAAVIDVRAALAGLAPRERAVSVLRYYDDLTVPEIAHELGVSPGAVKRYLSEAHGQAPCGARPGRASRRACRDRRRDSTESRMTAHLRDLLGQLADHEARASAAAAPDPGVEAVQMRAAISRRRTRRVVVVAVGAAAAVAIGVVTANAVTAPLSVLPALPDHSQTVTQSPTPSPAAPSDGPSATAPTEPLPSISSTVPTPATTGTPPPARPVEADISHGDEVWGAYVAVVDSFESEAAVAAKARVTELGYTPSGGDIGCDDGASEALGLPSDAMVVAVYLTTQEGAATFVEMYGAGAVGFAHVTLLCLD